MKTSWCLQSIQHSNSGIKGLTLKSEREIHSHVLNMGTDPRSDLRVKNDFWMKQKAKKCDSTPRMNLM